MATRTIAWETGEGNIYLDYTGNGNGNIVVTSDPNNLGVPRSKQIVVKTADNAVSRQLTINQEANYQLQYFTLTALEIGSFSLEVPAGITATEIPGGVSYSVDGGTTWVTTQITSEAQTITTPIIARGANVMWKAIANRFGTSSSNYCKFTSTGFFEASGNIMSLEYGDNFANQTSVKNYTYSFYGLFAFSTKLISAKNIMLPATTLREHCYQAMFSGCNALTNGPELPATILANACYRSMFMNCSSITDAPKLRATTLVTNCYYTMFSNCSKLSGIICLATKISASGCTTNWVNGVGANGTFTKAANMSSWTTGANGIPSGWTVNDYQ